MTKKRKQPKVVGYFAAGDAIRGLKDKPGDRLYIARLCELGMPLVESVKRKCYTCQRDVWVEKRTAATADASNRITCVECLENSGVDLGSLLADALGREMKS